MSDLSLCSGFNLWQFVEEHTLSHTHTHTHCHSSIFHQVSWRRCWLRDCCQQIHHFPSILPFLSYPLALWQIIGSSKVAMPNCVYIHTLWSIHSSNRLFIHPVPAAFSLPPSVSFPLRCRPQPYQHFICPVMTSSYWKGRRVNTNTQIQDGNTQINYLLTGGK